MKTGVKMWSVVLCFASMNNLAFAGWGIGEPIQDVEILDIEDGHIFLASESTTLRASGGFDYDECVGSGEFYEDSTQLVWNDHGSGGTFVYLAGSPRGEEINFTAPQEEISHGFMEVVATDADAAGVLADDEDVSDNREYKTAKLAIKEFAGRPTHQYALNTNFVAQVDDLQVLKGWESKFTSNEISDRNDVELKWQRKAKGDAEWADVGQGSSYEEKEDDTGEYQIRAVALIGGQLVPTDAIDLLVGEVKIESFELVASGEYTRDVRGAISFPQNGSGLRMQGKVSYHGDVVFNKFKWGFVQEIKSMNGRGPYIHSLWQVDYDLFTWDVIADGIHANVFAASQKWRIDDDAPRNDAPKGYQLYGKWEGVEIGKFAEWEDIPGRPRNPGHFTKFLLAFEDDLGRETASAPISMVESTWKFHEDFTVWLVVYRGEDGVEVAQYDTFVQQSWRLDAGKIPAGQLKGVWTAKPIGEPEIPNRRPTSAEATSDDLIEDHKWFEQKIFFPEFPNDPNA